MATSGKTHTYVHTNDSIRFKDHERTFNNSTLQKTGVFLLQSTSITGYLLCLQHCF